MLPVIGIGVVLCEAVVLVTVECVVILGLIVVEWVVGVVFLVVVVGPASLVAVKLENSKISSHKTFAKTILDLITVKIKI